MKKWVQLSKVSSCSIFKKKCSFFFIKFCYFYLNLCVNFTLIEFIKATENTETNKQKTTIAHRWEITVYFIFDHFRTIERRKKKRASKRERDNDWKKLIESKHMCFPIAFLYFHLERQTNEKKNTTKEIKLNGE
jgi:hypothetical protein